MKRCVFLLCLGVMSGVSLASPHTHGVSQVEVSVEGQRLMLQWRAALDDVVGFEHAPRTAAQKQQVAQVMEQLKQPQKLFVPAAPARCELKTSTISAPVLEGAATGSGHADLTLQMEWVCAQPQQLSHMEVLAFDSFKRVRRIDAQVVTPRGQSKVAVRGKARTIALSP